MSGMRKDVRVSYVRRDWKGRFARHIEQEPGVSHLGSHIWKVDSFEKSF